MRKLKNLRRREERKAASSGEQQSHRQQQAAEPHGANEWRAASAGRQARATPWPQAATPQRKRREDRRSGPASTGGEAPTCSNAEARCATKRVRRSRSAEPPGRSAEARWSSKVATPVRNRCPSPSSEYPNPNLGEHERGSNHTAHVNIHMLSGVDKLGTLGVPGEPRRPSDGEVFAAECNPIHEKEDVHKRLPAGQHVVPTDWDLAPLYRPEARWQAGRSPTHWVGCPAQTSGPEHAATADPRGQPG